MTSIGFPLNFIAFEIGIAIYFFTNIFILSRFTAKKEPSLLLRRTAYAALVINLVLYLGAFCFAFYSFYKQHLS